MERIAKTGLGMALTFSAFCLFPLPGFGEKDCAALRRWIESLHSPTLTQAMEGEDFCEIVSAVSGSFDASPSIEFLRSKILKRIILLEDQEPGLTEKQTSKKKRRYSQQSAYLAAAGWETPTEFKSARGERGDPGKGFQTSTEHYAGNAVRYFMDPHFALRRPALNRYFENRFERGSHADALQNVLIPLRGAGLFQLDLNRIKELHYLLMDPGEPIESRYGHSLLRVVLEEADDETSAIVPDDFTIDFIAYSGSSLSVWKGLRGKYPTRIQFIPFAAIKESYNQVQLRGGISFPLQLTADECRATVLRALEMHWDYFGRFYFLSNNCATELYDLIRSANYLKSEQLRDHPRSPKALKKVFVKAGLIDPAMGQIIEEKPEQAMHMGLLMPPYSGTLEAAFHVLSQQLNLSMPAYQDYLDTKGVERKALFDELLQVEIDQARLEPLHQRLQAILAVLLLEEHLDSLQTAELIEMIQQQYIDYRKEGPVSDAIKEIVFSSIGFGRWKKDFDAVPGYGIPEEEAQRAAISSKPPRGYLNELPSDDKKWLAELFPELWSEYLEGIDHIEALRASVEEHSRGLLSRFKEEMGAEEILRLQGFLSGRWDP